MLFELITAKSGICLLIGCERRKANVEAVYSSYYVLTFIGMQLSISRGERRKLYHRDVLYCQLAFKVEIICSLLVSVGLVFLLLLVSCLLGTMYQ